MSENDHDYDYDEPEVTARGCLLAVPIAIALWVGIFFALRAFFS